MNKDLLGKKIEEFYNSMSDEELKIRLSNSGFNILENGSGQVIIKDGDYEAIDKTKALKLAEDLGIKATFNSENPGVTVPKTGESFDFKVFFSRFFAEEELDIDFERKFMTLKPEEVFRPAAFPQYTYVSRKSPDFNIDYELRLQQALKITGCLTSIVGPSKMGKTVLCEKVIPRDKIIEVTGSDFNDKEFWNVIGEKVGLPSKGAFSETNKIEGNDSSKEISKKENYFLNKDNVINHFKENDYVLVLDDFHYAKEEVQLYIAQQLKDAIRKELKAIIISLPHRADDAIRKNADLSGRLSLINMEPWQIKELEEIAEKGFNQLGVKIDEKIAGKISVESLTSPQLMQYICLSVCTLLGLDENKVGEIPESMLEKAYRFTTANFEYEDVVKVLKEGPNQRGRQRKIFNTDKGKALDIYGLIIESIAENPPLVKLTLDEMKDRIDNLIVDSTKNPDKQAIRESLKKLQIIIDAKENIYKVFEWKDNILHILDPLFLFYLRWGKH